MEEDEPGERDAEDARRLLRGAEDTGGHAGQACPDARQRGRRERGHEQPHARAGHGETADQPDGQPGGGDGGGGPADQREARREDRAAEDGDPVAEAAGEPARLHRGREEGGVERDADHARRHR
ncbi:hypothetical protein GCM10022244_58220 [Streptomyces gulbargensis]|uniref:Uncharacterized protein n=1 Tax=Streptomyces gulbargensis TaxID=364901 RepID=A0ABP7NDU2_9ACTN